MIAPGTKSTVWFAAAAALIVSLFLSAPSTGGMFPPPWDKLAHFGFFGCLTGLLAMGFGRDRIGFAFLTAVLAGIADESYQIFLPTRSADLMDLLTDIVAAACATVCARYLLSGTRFDGAPGDSGQK